MSDLAPWAERYVGIPFKPKGRDRSGCDCYGLVRLIYREVFGIDLPAHDADYERLDPVILERLIRGEAGWQQVTTPRIGDIVLARRRRRRRAVHMGVVVSWNAFVHVTLMTPAVIEPLDGEWRGRIAGFFRRTGDDAA